MLLVALAFVGLGAARLGTEPAVAPPPPAVPRPVASPPAPVGPAGSFAEIPEPPERPAFQRDYEGRAGAVLAACDLPVLTRCRGTTCVGLLTAPDLDRIEGWLRLGLDSPRFVASTALRDLGVPLGELPCGAAIDRLLADTGARGVELPDGTEVWCTIDDSERAQGWRATGDALCSELATERVGEQAARFAEPRLRELDLSPPQREGP